MGKRTRRYFSPEDKVRILKRHLVDKVPVSELCDQLSIQPALFYLWQKQLFERGGAAFAGDKPDAQERRKDKKIEDLQAKLTRKDSVIAEVSEELVLLKKVLGEP
jgi:transposase